MIYFLVRYLDRILIFFLVFFFIAQILFDIVAVACHDINKLLTNKIALTVAHFRVMGLDCMILIDTALPSALPSSTLPPSAPHCR